MKRKALEKMLRIAGCYLKREGSSHSLWINPETGVVEAVPRHTEILEPADIRQALVIAKTPLQL
ncbi:MAG: type II toxin-antitoxin system HicA family toxin [Desulfosalsimonas sp.]